jgi:hypothetical protein
MESLFFVHIIPSPFLLCSLSLSTPAPFPTSNRTSLLLSGYRPCPSSQEGLSDKLAPFVPSFSHYTKSALQKKSLESTQEQKALSAERG